MKHLTGSIVHGSIDPVHTTWARFGSMASLRAAIFGTHNAEEGAASSFPCEGGDNCGGREYADRGGSRGCASLLRGCILICSVTTVTGRYSERELPGASQYPSYSLLLGASKPVEPDFLNCSKLTPQGNEACELRNGCSWCVGVGLTFNETLDLWEGNETSCRHWQHCEGPASLCELLNETECMNIDMEGILGEAPAPPREGTCVWCSSETRCVIETDNPAPCGRDTDIGQCMGCRGGFDSGVYLDYCNMCGGGCNATDLTLENPSCTCLGCDLVPFSRKETDICGVCGGSNETCSLLPVTLEQQVGVVLALCGNIVISVSLNIQKYTHNLNQAATGGEMAYTDIPLWWTGMALMVVGETGNFLAYAYAPATLVAPLGAVTVVSNCIIAHYVLKEAIRKRNIAGVILAIIGAVFIVVYAPDSQKQLTMELLEQYMLEPSFIAFILCILLAITGLFLCVVTV